MTYSDNSSVAYGYDTGANGVGRLTSIIESAADALLPPQDAVMAVDRRFLPGNADADEVAQIPVPRFYTPGRMPAEDVDAMYSEIVLLDMKIY